MALRFYLKHLTLISGLIFLPPFQAWAKGEPKIYIMNRVAFLDPEQKKETINKFVNLFPMRKLIDDEESSSIPLNKGKKYFLPGPQEKLWVFFNSDLMGTTKVKNYGLSRYPYDGTRIYFYEDKKFDFKSTNNNVPVFVSVPAGTAQVDLPKPYHAVQVSEKEKKRLIWLFLNYDLNTQSKPTSPLLSGPSAANPGLVPTPTMTPMPNQFRKFEKIFNEIIYPPPSKKTPGISHHNLDLFYGLTPTSPEDFRGKLEIGYSVDFPEEGIKFFEIIANGILYGDGKDKKFICSIGGKIQSIGSFYKDDTILFDQAFQTMGKKYIVFTSNNGTSDTWTVFRVDPGNIVEVAQESSNYD